MNYHGTSDTEEEMQGNTQAQIGAFEKEMTEHLKSC